jgi:small nuclear ribonucleoprotein D3
MNVQLKEVHVTARDGRVSQLEQVYIRGSQVRFFIVPDMLKNAPMFKNVKPGSLKGRGIGMGRGRATVARAQGTYLYLNALLGAVAKQLFLTNVLYSVARGRGGRGGFRGGRGGGPGMPPGRGRPY